MAKALRSDLIDSPCWADFVRLAHHRMDAFHPEKCPSCDVQYTVLFVVFEDTEAAVKLLRERLPRECPDHQPELYIINEDTYQGRIVAQDAR
jgi:hypothetical protein